MSETPQDSSMEPQGEELPHPLLLIFVPIGTVLLTVLMSVVAVQYWRLLLGTVFGLCLSIPFLWMLVSAMRPAFPNRDCPECGGEGLVCIDPQKDFGVRCLFCDYRDPERHISYLMDLMNDPEIAQRAGFVIDEYGQAHLPSK